MGKIQEARELLAEINKLEGQLCQIVADARFAGKMPALFTALGEDECLEVQRRVGSGIVPGEVPWAVWWERTQAKG